MIFFERKRERAVVNDVSIATVSKAALGKLLRNGVERIIKKTKNVWAFPSAVHSILNWTEPVAIMRLKKKRTIAICGTGT